MERVGRRKYLQRAVTDESCQDRLVGEKLSERRVRHVERFVTLDGVLITVDNHDTSRHATLEPAVDWHRRLRRVRVVFVHRMHYGNTQKLTQSVRERTSAVPTANICHWHA